MTISRRSALAMIGAGLISSPLWAASPIGWPKQLRYAIVPNEGDNAIAGYARLLKHVEKKLGIPVVSYPVNDVPAVIVALANGQVDVARIGGESYVIARRQGNVDALATEETSEGTGYYGGLWVRSDSGIHSVAQTRGKCLAFNGPNSTSGYLAPMNYFMKDLKVDPDKFFSRIVFAGGAVPAVLALVNKQVDVCAASFPYEALAVKQGLVKQDELMAIWKSPLIPNPAYVVRGDFPKDFRRAFLSALTSYQDEVGLAALPGGVKRIVATSDSEYDFVRQLEQIKTELQTRAKS
ncbi:MULTISPECIES: phosphate/phosphite/phosphonate ABC transporter substrate-binding protein [Paraburkholderia]|nr:phosphate/phosphite/phosphonate ABC transporter substrate-binding protein [Paraburkholderia podalyriae]